MTKCISMKKNLLLTILMLFAISSISIGQQKDPTVESIIEEAKQNSHLKTLAHELMDEIGPRLVGTPQNKEARDWAVDKFESWGISAENEQWGEWKGWERGITHIDLLEPRTISLDGMQLAWSPETPEGGVKGSVAVIPDIADSAAFQEWLPSVEGKFVLVSMLQPTGRPEDNWEEWATDESMEKMKEKRKEQKEAWREKINNTGYTKRELILALEEAGAAGIIQSYWSKGFGANKIFGAHTENIPTIDISLEDYGLLYRLAEHGDEPIIKVETQSKDLGMVPTLNTIARIEGTEKPEEYVLLSAHFDSWDGATGATDNGTGSITMMETARILKKVYPNPKRTILVGLWGAEEQGLNGSRAFVKDHPKIIKNLEVAFNQDNGTGRVVQIEGQGFVDSYDYLGNWLSAVPKEVSKHIETTFPGMPGRGGSDYASFVAAGAPGISLTSLSWNYWNYTWHTNLDTYDKIVFDEVRNNVILTAILAYKASEDDQKASRKK